jgi:L-fuconolactonase
LYRPVLPAEYQALTKPLGVTGTVIVEASPWVEDNQWVLDLADRNPFIVGLVGNLSPGTPEFAKHLDRFAKHPRFRGIRVNHAAVKAGLPEKSFLGDLQRLVNHDLELDINGGPDMLPDIARLAKVVPSLRIVINHVANVRIDGKQPPEAWQSGMEACAALEKVYCKVSALVEGARRDDSTAPQELEFYLPVLDAVWKCFGADRLIYGSNWPVSARYAPYAQVQRIVSEYFQTKGRAAYDKFFWKNAQAAYRWPK